MSTPPDPGVTSSFLSIVAALTWSAVSGSLGRCVDGTSGRYVFVKRGSSAATVEWDIANSLPTNFAEHLMTQDTFDVLDQGTLQTSGLVQYRSQNYRIESRYDGTYMVCAAIAV